MSDLLNSASLVMVPSGYKEDTVYSVVPSDGSGDLSFTRASNGSRVNSAGLVEVCPWNLLQQSEAIGVVSPWANSNLTITANSVIAPNGTTTADVLTETTATTTQFRTQQTTPQSTNIYTLSVYVKNITGTRQAYIDLGPVTGFFNFATETTYSASAIASFENVGNGWYRFSLTTATAITPSTIYMGLGQSNSETYTGNGTSAIAFWGAQLNIGSTAKPYFPTTDRLNVPRLTYQNGGGGCPSLLLEKQSTNLLSWSEDLTNAVYLSAAGAGGSITRTANYAISPDGTQNADRLQFVRGSSYAELYQRVATTIGVTYTFSFYAKSLSGTPTLNTAWNGTQANEVTFTTEWVRYTYTFVASSTSSGFNFITWTSLPNTSTTADILVYGAQVEASSYPTSYIPTTSSSATRVADACFKTGISSLIGQTEGTLFADIVTPTAIPSGAEILPISIFPSGGGTGGTQAYIAFLSNGVIRFIYFTGSIECNISTATGFWSAGNRYKLAAVYKQNDFAFYINGVQIGVDNSGNVIAMADLYLNYQGILEQNTINQVALFKTRLTNAELASLTTI